MGSYFWGDWAYSFLPDDAPSVAPLHINVKEAFAIYLAVRRWGSQWANHHVIIHCDNQAAVSMINKGATANPNIMPWLWHLFWISAIHNFRITAVYVPGISNIHADRISRMQNGVPLLQLCYLSCVDTHLHTLSPMSSLSTTCHRIVLCFFVLGSALVYKELTEEIAFFCKQTFAPSTHQDTYLHFCHTMNIPLVPSVGNYNNGLALSSSISSQLTPRALKSRDITIRFSTLPVLEI